MIEDYIKKDYLFVESVSVEDLKQKILSKLNVYFPAGEFGYYNLEGYTEIENKLYQFNVEPNWESKKMEVGERYHWVEGISNFICQPCEKPEPKKRVQVQLEFDITQDTFNMIIAYLEREEIQYNVYHI